MESKFKRLLSLLMVVFMIVSMCPTTVFAADTESSETESSTEDPSVAYGKDSETDWKAYYVGELGYTCVTIASFDDWKTHFANGGESLINQKDAAYTADNPRKVYVEFTESITNNSTGSFYYLGAGTSAVEYLEVVLDLNGNTITKSAKNRIFGIYGPTKVTVLDGRLIHSYTGDDAKTNGLVFTVSGAKSSLSLDNVYVDYNTNNAAYGGIIAGSGADQIITINNSYLDASDGKASNGGAIRAAGKTYLTGNTQVVGGTANNGGAIYSAGDIVIDGATVTGGTAIGTTGNSYGGAVYVTEEGSLTINGGTITGGSATPQTPGKYGHGGAVYSLGDIVMNGNASIVGGTARYGAGVEIAGNAAMTVKGNSSITAGEGTTGTVVYAGATTNSFKMYGGTITGNSTKWMFRIPANSTENAIFKVYNGTLTGVDINKMVYSDGTEHFSPLAECACANVTTDDVTGLNTYTIWQYNLDETGSGTCEDCGHTYENACTGTHTWDEGVEQTPATCTEKGETLYTCTICSSKKTETDIPVIPHSYTDGVCVSGCGKTQCDNEGHALTSVAAKAPTCTEIGWDAYEYCTRCDYTTYAEKEALDHDWSNWTPNEDGTHSRVCGNDANHTEEGTCDNNGENGACSVCGYVALTYVAQIGEQKFTSLQAAFDAVQDGETIVLLDNITITAATAGYNDGTYIDGARYTGDESFTVDFGGYTVTDDGCVNDYLIYINNKGANENQITFKNGTIISENGCWATVCVNSAASTQEVVLNLDGMNVTNSNDAEFNGNMAVRARNMSTVNANAGTIITSNGASYGITASTSGSVINVNDGATVIQKNSGTTSGNSVFAAVGGKGVMNINNGATITSDKYGVHTMTTGTPVVNVNGGTITAPIALKASTNGGVGELATIKVTGGTINGALETYTNNGVIAVSGGTFSEPVAEEYCADGYIPADNGNGTYGVKEGAYVAQVGQQKFTTLMDAWTAAVAGGYTTVTLLADVEMPVTGEYLYVPATGMTLDLGGYTLGIPYRELAFAGDNFTITNGTIDSLGASYGLWIGGYNDDAAASNVTIEDVEVLGGINIKNATNVTLKNVTVNADVAGEENDYYAVYVNGNATGVVIESGTYTAADGKATVYVNGVATVADGVAASVAAVAKVGNTYYGNLAEAVAAVNANGGTLTLLADANESITFNGTSAITLDLNGFTITSDASTVVAEGSNVTIKDSDNTGKIISTNAGGEAIAIKGGAKVVLESGYVYNDAYAVYLYSSANNSFVMNGGTVKSGNTGIYAASVDGNVEINDGTVEAPYMAFGVYAGSLNIKGGTVIADSYLLWSWNNSPISISGGTFSKEPSYSDIVYGYGITANSNGTYTVSEVDPMIFIGATGYYTLEEAFAAASENDVITITKAGKYNWPKTAIPAGVTVKGTVDGVVATSDSDTWINGTVLTVENVDFSADYRAAYITNGKASDMTFTDCTFTGTWAFHVDSAAEDAEFTFNNCVFNGYTSFGASVDSVDVNDGEINGFFVVRQDATIDDVAVSEDVLISLGGNDTVTDVDVKINNCTVKDTNNDGSTPALKEVIDDVNVSDASNNMVVVDDEVVYGGVAKIGETRYATLAEAFAAAQDGETVTLLDDVELETSASNGAFEIAGGRELTLDLNGFDITAGAREGYTNRTQYAFDNYADLTITGEGTITARGIQNYGKLTIDSADVTIIACDTNGGSAVYAYPNSVTNISAGTYKTNGGETAVITSYGTLNITGGTYTQAAGNAATYAIICYDEAQLSNATVTGVHGAVYAGAVANVTIESGNYTVIGVTGQSDHCVYAAAGGVLTVKGGNFVGEATPDAGGQVVYGAGATIYGGTFSANETDNCAEGYAALANLDGKYVVGAKPTATINDMGKLVVEAGEYMVYGSGDNSVDMPLNFVMQFLADQDAEDMETSPFADWYGDFVITITGLEEGSFTANNCYLAGYYGDYGWIQVPIDDMVIEDGVRYPVMLGVGLGQKYDYICTGVKDFRCAMYIDPAILDANPNIEVTLELSLVDNSKGQDAAKEALVKEEGIYRIEDLTYEAEDFLPDVASVTDAEGNVTNYKTLAEAIAAAEDGDTVTLLADATGAGAVIDESITIDFAGHTYTLTEGVGSGTLTSNGFQVMKDNRVIFKNGTLKVADADKAEFYTLIQNYADLTVEGMTLDGTNLDKWSATDGDSYVLSINNGAVTVKDTTIIANDEGDLSYAMDAYDNTSYAGVPTVTLTGTTNNIQGNIEVTGGNLDIEAATITGELVYKTGTVTKADTVVLEAPADYKWVAGVLTAKNYVAQVGDVKYESLAEAFAAAQAGDTINLLTDITVTDQIKVADQAVLNNITFNGNGHTITADLDQANESVLYFGDTATHAWATGVTVKDVTITGTARFGIALMGGTTSILENVTITGDYLYGINLYGTHGAEMKNCDIVTVFTNGSDDYPLNLVDSHIGHLYANESEITEGAKVFIDAASTVDELTFWGDSSVMIDAASTAQITKINDAVAVIDGIYYTTLEAAVAAANGNTVVLLVDAIEDLVLSTAVVLDLNGNTFSGTITLSTADATLKAVADLDVVTTVADSKVAYINGVYKVVSENIVVWNTVTGELYETVAKAVSEAAENETIQLLANSDESNATILFYENITLDLNGKTLKAKYVLAPFASSSIIDSTEGEGLLVVERSRLSMMDNSYVPVWVEGEGFRFTSISVTGIAYDLGEGNAQFKFRVNRKEADHLLAQHLVDGGEDNGVTIKVLITWTNPDGTPGSMPFVFSEALVKQYASSWTTKEFILNISGVENLSELAFTAIVCYGDSVDVEGLTKNPVVKS